MENHRVVVTGVGVVSPGASNKAAFLEMLKEGNSGIEFLPELKANNFNCQIGGKAIINKESVAEIFDEYDINDTGEFVELTCAAGIEAWKDAGLNIPDYEDANTDWDTGMMIGSGFSGLDYGVNKVGKAIEDKRIRFLKSQTIACTMGSGGPAYLSNILGISNQVSGISSACCSGTEAIIDSYHKIKFGLAERMIAGGTEAFSIPIWAMFDAARVTNKRFNNQPKLASRPMSESARGFVFSSGSAILVLENLNSAKKRGARIYAEVLSGMVNSGGQRNGGSMSFPNNEGVKRCINTAIQRAGINIDEIDLISGHLNGTKADLSEIKNWVNVFKERKNGFPFVNSTKSMIGHLLGAAGAIESVASVLQLHHQFIHPSINCEDVNKDIAAIIPVERIPQKMMDTNLLNIIIKGNFGYGDVNSVVIFKKWNFNS